MKTDIQLHCTECKEVRTMHILYKCMCCGKIHISTAAITPTINLLQKGETETGPEGESKSMAVATAVATAEAPKVVIEYQWKEVEGGLHMEVRLEWSRPLENGPQDILYTKEAAVEAASYLLEEKIATWRDYLLLHGKNSSYLLLEVDDEGESPLPKKAVIFCGKRVIWGNNQTLEWEKGREGKQLWKVRDKATGLKDWIERKENILCNIDKIRLLLGEPKF